MQQTLITNNYDSNKNDIVKEQIEIIKSIGEIIGLDRIENLLRKKPNKRAYDGFEPSGRMHVAQGLLRTINVNKITKSGDVKFVFWVADYFAQLNLKMGGDINKIRKAGQLMIHTWKACGMDINNVEFIWSSEEIHKRPAEYWNLVFDIATKFTLSRILRCTQIMGRKDFKSVENNSFDRENKLNNEIENNEINAVPYEDMVTSMKSSQIFYPVMQCADIFFLNIDICSLGMDQRKVNMLAIEYCDLIKRKLKPIIVSHPMLMGLDGSDKMAKSNPNSAIFMDDSDQDIDAKINQAYCKPGDIKKNPILEYFKYIVFEKELSGIIINVFDPVTKISSAQVYNDYKILELDFADKKIHPSDLKKTIKLYLKKYLDPVRKYFENNVEADALRKEVKNFTK